MIVITIIVFIYNGGMEGFLAGKKWTIFEGYNWPQKSGQVSSWMTRLV